MSVVVDASAVLAILFDERGGDIAASMSKGAILSAVNAIEVMEKFVERHGGTERERQTHFSNGWTYRLRLSPGRRPCWQQNGSPCLEAKTSHSLIAHAWHSANTLNCPSSPLTARGRNSTSASISG
jgi:hypothetical protein